MERDKLYLESLQRSVLSALPHATCQLFQRVSEARPVAREVVFTLFVCGIEAVDGDTVDLISECLAPECVNRAVLVIVPRADPRIGAMVHASTSGGAFDSSTEDPRNFASVVKQVMSGRSYCSPSCRSTAKAFRIARERISILTPTERLVLALIGDGCDDRTASERIGMKPSSIQAVRKSIHGKLNICQKGELVNVAAQCGFVRVSGAGVTPVGLGILLAEYQARSKRPLPMPPRLAAEYPAAVEAAARRRLS
ncbi:MAG: hypothetical protein ACREH8_20350 [Opitutaceae bacterium]